MKRVIALQRVAEKTEEKRAVEEEERRKLKEEERDETSRRIETQIAEVKEILASLTLALQNTEKQKSDLTNS